MLRTTSYISTCPMVWTGALSWLALSCFDFFIACIIYTQQRHEEGLDRLVLLENIKHTFLLIACATDSTGRERRQKGLDCCQLVLRPLCPLHLVKSAQVICFRPLEWIWGASFKGIQSWCCQWYEGYVKMMMMVVTRCSEGWLWGSLQWDVVFLLTAQRSSAALVFGPIDVANL